MANYTTADLCDTLNQLNHDSWYGEEDAPDFVEELKACAYNIVRENPGIDRSEWIDELIRQYPTEVVDAYLSGEKYIEALKLIAAHYPEGYADDDESDHPSHRERIEFLTHVRSHPEISNTVNKKLREQSEKKAKAERNRERYNANFYDPVYN